MRISSKGRYAVAAMTELAGVWKNGGSLTVLRISEALGISKIYLEQVFSLLKRAQLFIDALPPKQQQRAMVAQRL